MAFTFVVFCSSHIVNIIISANVAMLALANVGKAYIVYIANGS